MTGFYDGSGNPMFDSPDIEFEDGKPAGLANAVVLATTLPYGSLSLEDPAATTAVGEAGVDRRFWVMLPDEAETVSTADLTTMAKMVQEGDTVIISAADEETVWSIRDVVEGIISDS